MMEVVLMRISAPVPAKIHLIDAETWKMHCLHKQQLMHHSTSMMKGAFCNQLKDLKSASTGKA